MTLIEAARQNEAVVRAGDDSVGCTARHAIVEAERARRQALVLDDRGLVHLRPRVCGWLLV